jgi:TolA-binding protein
MTILKKLGFALLSGVCLIYADVDSDIRDNEVLINSLQDKMDAAQAKGDPTDDLQKVMDRMIEKQNAILAKKASGAASNDGEIATDQSAQSQIKANGHSNGTDLEETIRKIVKEELARQMHAKDHSNEAKAEATKKAETTAPDLPEQKSEAMAQYELALEQYEKKNYKLAASSFGRIIKTYPKDPITAKALVHLAFCLEKQGELEKAAVVCESALQRELDGGHQVDCQLIRLRFAKGQKNEGEIAEITKALKKLKMTDEQKKTYSSVLAKNNN